MDAALATDIAVVDASAWQIDFGPDRADNQEPVVVIKEPANLVACAQPIEFAEALAAVAVKAPIEVDSDRGALTSEFQKPLLLLCLPPGSGLAADIETAVEAWIMRGSDELIHPVRAGLRTSRVIWTSDRAVIYAGQDQMSDAIDAVLRFTVAARLTARLESEMSATWPLLDDHARLTHAVTPKDQQVQPLVNSMTLRVTQMMSSLLRLEGSLEQVDPGLSAASKRLFAELVQQGAFYERLEILEDPIEHAVDVYETANSRLTEAKFASRSYAVEKWIAVFLAAELVLMTFSLLSSGAIHIFGH